MGWRVYTQQNNPDDPLLATTQGSVGGVLLSDQAGPHAGMRDGGVLSVTLLHCSPLSLPGIWTRH